MAVTPGKWGDHSYVMSLKFNIIYMDIGPTHSWVDEINRSEEQTSERSGCNRSIHRMSTFVKTYTIESLWSDSMVCVFTSIIGNTCMIVAHAHYPYEILVWPIKTKILQEINQSHDSTWKFSRARGITPKFHLRDNEISQETKELFSKLGV